MKSGLRFSGLIAAATLAATVITGADAPGALADVAGTQASPLDEVVPLPAVVEPDADVTFRLTPATAIFARFGSDETVRAATLLAEDLRPATGFPLPVVRVPDLGTPPGISLRLVPDDGRIGQEGYRLDVTRTAVTIAAASAAGLTNGVHTLRQLLPPEIESETRRDGPWLLPGGRIIDHPRYAYRGAMLDLARYYFPPDVVKRHIDKVSMYKINYLHLHLTDDQGWRVEIDSWPRLATYGGSTQTGGGPGGYYTKDEYRDIVSYAQRRNVTIVPEIDVPGHTNAALASYAELNCDGIAPPLYTGWDVGFSSLCLGRPVTEQFVDDVIREVAAMTPGEYLHIGGDEATAGTPEADYVAFMDMAAGIVAKYGKKVIGWHESLKGTPPSTSVGQYWYPWPDDETAAGAAARGARLIMSPANRAYLDMKYTPTVPEFGQVWAGFVEAENAYAWDPDTTVNGVAPASVLGVEATMFTQIAPDEKSVDFMVFPRLPEIAEVAWTPREALNWESIRARLPEQGQRWDLWGINYYRSPQIPWAAQLPVG